MAKKQPVADLNDEGQYQRSWLWQCDECGERLIWEAKELPTGWGVDDEEDLENARAVCDECLSEGLEP